VSGLLVVNAGSSSIKFALFDRDDTTAPRAMHGEIEGLGTRVSARVYGPGGVPIAQDLAGATTGTDHQAALGALLAFIRRHGEFDVRAAGHRVVHGGTDYAAPIRLDDRSIDRLRAYIPLAPLHQPHNLAAIEALRALRPDLPQVACFDTAFHTTQPWESSTFALPQALTDAGVRRYGFHGLSYEYIASQLPGRLGVAADGRIVVAHLGNGASMCALRGRRSVASTMGFSALDGLVMGTRCGNIDPAVPLYLMQHLGMDAAALSDLFYRRSGLLGVSGLSSDMRTLLASDDPRAERAVALFVYRAVRELGSLAAALGGLDALVFTAGIGEHAATVRERICAGAGWLGVELDRAANARHAERIEAAGSRVAVLVLPTDEELMIARHACQVLRDIPR
jgi:acetate kinase